MLKQCVVSFVALSAVVCLGGCQTPGEVMDQVMVDFGMKEKPEGYVSGSDRVFERLSDVGATELKRLNIQGRRGEVKYQREGDFQGKYYREIKVYEGFHPLDANATNSGANDDRGYIGLIEYDYQVYQSRRMTSRTQAEMEPATIRTDEQGTEVYRYRFSGAGTWNGSDGERVKK